MLIRKDPLKSHTLLRVLVIKLSSFGDIIHSLPVIECFNEYSRKNNQKVELHWLIEKRWSPIIENHNGVHNVILTNTKKWRRSFFHRSTWQEISDCLSSLRRNTYDIVLDINGLLRSAMFARLARARLRVGFSRDSDICKEKQGVYLLDKTLSVPHIHVVDQTVQLLEKTLLINISKPLMPYLPPNTMVEGMAKQVLKQNDLTPKDFAIIVTGGGWETKLLDERLMTELCDHISKCGLKPVISWSGTNEKQRAVRITELSRNNVKQLGNLSIDVFMEVLRMSRMAIGPDTGTIHAASAVETPTVSYYGPSSAMYSGPRRPTDRVVQLSPSCGPCFKRQCDKNLCNHLSIQKVLDEISNQL